MALCVPRVPLGIPKAAAPLFMVFGHRPRGRCCCCKHVPCQSWPVYAKPSSAAADNPIAATAATTAATVAVLCHSGRAEKPGVSYCGPDKAPAGIRPVGERGSAGLCWDGTGPAGGVVVAIEDRNDRGEPEMRRAERENKLRFGSDSPLIYVFNLSLVRVICYIFYVTTYKISSDLFVGLKLG